MINLHSIIFTMPFQIIFNFEKELSVRIVQIGEEELAGSQLSQDAVCHSCMATLQGASGSNFYMLVSFFGS